MEVTVSLVLNYLSAQVLPLPLSIKTSQTLLLVCMVMALLTKDRFMKQQTWQHSGNYLCFMSVKITSMVWEPPTKELLITPNSTPEET
jgi:hypothetical protein